MEHAGVKRPHSPDAGEPSAAASSSSSTSAPPPRIGGVAISWNADKKFGFVQPHDGGEQLFCHGSAIEDGEALPYATHTHDRSLLS